MATEVGMLTGMTSRPMPSPGIKPIRSDLEAIGVSVEFITFRRFGAFEVEVSSAKRNCTYPGVTPDCLICYLR